MGSTIDQVRGAAEQLRLRHVAGKRRAVADHITRIGWSADRYHAIASGGSTGVGGVFGLHDPELAITPVAGFGRQDTGKVRRFFPLPR